MHKQQFAKSDITLSSVAGIGIFLVVLGHCGTIGRNFILHDWIYLFHMPLFFFMAGYSYKRHTIASERGMRAFGGVKFKRLILPYIVISSLAYPIKVILSQFALHKETLDILSYINQLLLPWSNTIIFFWFLPTLFFMFGVVHLALTKAHMDLWLLLLASCLLFVFQPTYNDVWLLKYFNLAGVFSNLVYFVLGAIATLRPLPRVHFSSVFILPVSAIVYYAFPYLGGNIFGSFLFALVGIAGVWSIASVFYIGLFDFWGNFSFSIYLFSWFPQVFIRILAIQILHLNFAVSAMLMLVSGLIVPIILVGILQQISLGPLLSFSFGLAKLPRPRSLLPIATKLELMAKF